MDFATIINRLNGGNMNFFNRALLSVKRKLGKSLILFVVVFILGNIIAGAISVRQAVNNSDENIRKSLGAEYGSELDYETISKIPDFDWNNIPMLTPEVINKIGGFGEHKDAFVRICVN